MFDMVNPLELPPREILASFAQYDRKLEGEVRFHFIPFAKQSEPVKLHYINLTPLLDFSEVPVPDVTGKTCRVGHRLEAGRGELEVGWGDIDKLNLVVKNVPQIHCDCRVFSTNLEAHVARPIFTLRGIIQRAIEFEDQEALAKVREMLPHDDAEKVFDFIFNRRVPSGRPPTYLAQPLSRLSQTITLTSDEYHVKN